MSLRQKGLQIDRSGPKAPAGEYSRLGTGWWSLLALDYFHEFHNSSVSSIKPLVSVGLPKASLALRLVLLYHLSSWDCLVIPQVIPSPYIFWSQLDSNLEPHEPYLINNLHCLNSTIRNPSFIFFCMKRIPLSQFEKHFAIIAISRWSSDSQLNLLLALFCISLFNASFVFCCVSS